MKKIILILSISVLALEVSTLAEAAPLCSFQALKTCKEKFRSCKMACRKGTASRSECGIACEEQSALCEDNAQSLPDCGSQRSDNEYSKWSQFADVD